MIVALWVLAGVLVYLVLCSVIGRTLREARRRDELARCRRDHPTGWRRW